MQTKQIIYYLLRLSIVIVILCSCCQGQQNEVSPKLDFEDEAVEKNNSSVPIVPGIKQNKNNEHDIEREKESEGKDKSRPKIHGVRVTVDTGDTQKSKESKESVEITDLGKNKKRVGIHTDITFEITADGDDHHNNKTSREQDVDKEDASVPIYKGRGGTTHKNRKPHEPKPHWNPNFSSERRIDYSGRGNYPDYYPEYYPNNVPVYIGATDTRGAGSPIYHQSDGGWNSYIPRWTTESSSYMNAYNKPSDITAYRNNAWKPCYCLVNGNDYRKRRDNRPHYHYQSQGNVGVIKPTSAVIEIVDGKLEKPFSRK